jgi:ribosome modulation factor
MSEREREDSARRKGRLAFYAGVSVDDCPLRASDSRLTWATAWREEESFMRSVKEREQRQLADRKANTCAPEGEA